MAKQPVQDMVAALRDVNGRYVGNRPVRLKKSNWKEKQNTGRVVGLTDSQVVMVMV